MKSFNLVIKSHEVVLLEQINSHADQRQKHDRKVVIGRLGHFKSAKSRNGETRIAMQRSDNSSPV